MATLTITTHHHETNHHEIEVDDNFTIVGPDANSWFLFSGKDGNQISVHERNVSAIELKK